MRTTLLLIAFTLAFLFNLSFAAPLQSDLTLLANHGTSNDWMKRSENEPDENEPDEDAPPKKQKSAKTETTTSAASAAPAPVAPAPATAKPNSNPLPLDTLIGTTTGLTANNALVAGGISSVTGSLGSTANGNNLSNTANQVTSIASGLANKNARIVRK